MSKWSSLGLKDTASWLKFVILKEREKLFINLSSWVMVVIGGTDWALSKYEYSWNPISSIIFFRRTLYILYLSQIISMTINAVNCVITDAFMMIQSSASITSLLNTTLSYGMSKPNIFSDLWNRWNILFNLNMLWVKRTIFWPFFTFKCYQKSNEWTEPNFIRVGNYSPIQSSFLQNFVFHCVSWIISSSKIERPTSLIISLVVSSIWGIKIL